MLAELRTTRNSLKKCLVAESEIETLNANWATELSSLKASRLKLYKSLISYFRMVRDNCCSMRDDFEEIESKLFSDNQISTLPIDTFDNIIEVDEFNYVKLKVCRILIRDLTS